MAKPLPDKTDPTSARLPTDSFYKSIINSLKEYALFSIDIHGEIISWNRGAATIFGYKEKEILKKNCSILFAPGNSLRTDPERELALALQKGKYHRESLNARKDGSLFWGDLYIYPIYDEQKNHIGFTKIIQNVTERKEKEKEVLKQNHEYAISIVQTAHEPMVVLNKDLTINTANNSFYQLFNFKKKELEGYLIYQLKNRHLSNSRLRELLEALQKNGESYTNYEIDIELPPTGVHSLMLNIRKLYSITHTEMILIAIEDITQKKLQDQQKDDFISIASHELKTPITHIKGLIQILKRQLQEGKKDYDKSLQLLVSQADRFAKLVNDLLDLSQLQTGKLTLYKQEFDLNELVHNTVEALKSINSSHQINVKGQINSPVYADRFKIAQVITNLISNAIKYSPQADKVQLTLSEDRNKSTATVCVKDYGIGINREEWHKIFQRFSRSSSAKEHNIPGIGLGLHISQDIIHQHGGKMWFKSEKDKGSRFYFSLPLHRAGARAVNAES